MSKLVSIYRACGNEIEESNFRPSRPKWFSKFKCWKSFFNSFQKEEIHIVWDGPENKLSEYIKSFPNHYFHNLPGVGNQKSLLACYDLAKQTNSEYINFVEDDYFWYPHACDLMLAGLVKFNFVTLYLHPDRTREPSDDITYGREFFLKTISSYWVSNESTTCSFACSRPVFNHCEQNLRDFCNKGVGAPDDRGFFREMAKNGLRLFSPVYAFSTHCEEPHVAQFMDWEAESADILL